jgi:hypothetical protein
MLSPALSVVLPFGESPLPFDPTTVDELERRFGADVPPPAGIDMRPPRKGSPPAGAFDNVEVRLYISHNSISSFRAVRAVEHITRAFPPAGLRVRILDVAHEIEAASQDRVLFTPTLIMTDRSRRSTRVLGDLSNAEVLVDLLRAAGLEPV